MEMHEIKDSSMFTHQGYHDGELHLVFRNGGATHAYPITPAQYAEFKAAPSAGKWFHQNGLGKKIVGRKVQLATAV